MADRGCAGGSKVVKSGKMTPVRGGPGHMFGKQHAGPQKPGTSSKSNSGDGGKWGKGGGKGFIGGKQPKSSKAVAGKVSVSKGK
jgi:hypothetical protein